MAQTDHAISIEAAGKSFGKNRASDGFAFAVESWQIDTLSGERKENLKRASGQLRLSVRRPDRSSSDIYWFTPQKICSCNHSPACRIRFLRFRLNSLSQQPY